MCLKQYIRLLLIIMYFYEPETKICGITILKTLAYLKISECIEKMLIVLLMKVILGCRGYGIFCTYLYF